MTDDPDDDENTPRTHHVTETERREHFGTYPPGTLVISPSGPAIAASAFEGDLATRVGRLEARAGDQHDKLESLLASRRTWRWVVGLGGPVAFGAIVTVLLYSADQVRSGAENAGATKAKIDAIDKRLDEFRGAFDRSIDKIIDDIRELRKHAGLDPKPLSFDGRIGSIP